MMSLLNRDSSRERSYTFSIPEDGERFKLQGEDLIAIIKERKKQKAEEEAKRQQNSNNRSGG
ncbi:MAG: hypothetical protein H6545_05860 [Bacteroidales bacterium]|nr:hypothetical protein [Bacteroidales bacterium]